MWLALVPLIIGSAVVPVQLIVTLLLLRSRSGRITAVAWVGGMTTVRLIQGVLFGLILSSPGATAEQDSSPGLIATVLFLLIAIVFYVAALKQIFGDDDPDAPPPKWLTMTESMSPVKAFLFGAGLLAIGAKFWVFTLGAIAAIGAADLGTSASIVSFVVFVVLAEILMIAIVAVAYLVPKGSAAFLEAAARGYESTMVRW